MKRDVESLKEKKSTKKIFSKDLSQIKQGVLFLFNFVVGENKDFSIEWIFAVFFNIIYVYLLIFFLMITIEMFSLTCQTCLQNQILSRLKV